MKFSINPPKGFLGWTVYLIIGKFLIDIGKKLWDNRGSSNETQEDMAEIRKALASQPTHEDIRDIVEKVCKNLATKEEVIHVRKELSLELKTEISLKFKDMEMMNKEALLRYENSIKTYENARTEHHKSKHRIDEVYGRLIKKLDDKK
jgi:hypothetical protein